MREGGREGGKPLPLAFQYLIFMVKRPCDLNLVMISCTGSKMPTLSSWRSSISLHKVAEKRAFQI